MVHSLQCRNQCSTPCCNQNHCIPGGVHTRRRHHTLNGAGGAMALLMARVDTYTIRFVSRWISNAIMCYLHTRQRKHAQMGSRRAWSNTGTMHLSHPSTVTETPTPRLWASPRPFMGYSGRPFIGLMSIWQINSPCHNNISIYITSSNVDTLIPLAGKVELATSPSSDC